MTAKGRLALVTLSRPSPLPLCEIGSRIAFHADDLSKHLSDPCATLLGEDLLGDSAGTDVATIPLLGGLIGRLL